MPEMKTTNQRHKGSGARRCINPPVEWMAAGLSEHIETLKQRLLRERLATFADLDPELQRSLQRAADDSAALAWTTSFPLLVLPALFDESSRAAVQRSERQRRIRARSGGAKSLAA
jgi:hypothetical protein